MSYLGEIGYLREKGLISCYADLETLPAFVLMDARMLHTAEAAIEQRQQRQQAPRRR